MNVKFPSTIFNCIELIVVPFFVTAVLLSPLLFVDIADSVYGMLIITCFGLICMLYTWIRNKKVLELRFSWSQLPASSIFLLYFLSTTLMIGIIYPFYFVMDSLTGLGGDVGSTPLFSIHSLGFLTVVPIVKEIVFRGIVLERLKEIYLDRSSILISSILFAVIHVNPLQMVVALFLGLLFGYVYLKSSSLNVVIGMHLVSNFFSLLTGEIRRSKISNVEESMVYGEYTLFIVFFSCLVLVSIAYVLISRGERFWDNDLNNKK